MIKTQSDVKGAQGLLAIVVLITAGLAVRHHDGHDFVYSVWTPIHALSSGLDPYDPTNAEYFRRYSVPVAAGLYTPTALVLHAPLALLSPRRSADAMALVNAAVLWLGVLLLIPPRTGRACVVAAVAGTVVIGSAAADHTIELGQLSGWAFAGVALFVASLRHNPSAVWLPAVGATLVALKPQSGVPFLLALVILGCWPVIKRAATLLVVTSVPGLVLFLTVAGNPAALVRIAVSNTQLMSRLPQADVANPHHLRIDALGIISHLGGPALIDLGWAAVTLLVCTALFVITVRDRDRALAPTDPYLVTLVTLYLVLSLYHLTYDQLLLYVGPLTALAAMTNRGVQGSTRVLAVGGAALLGAGLMFRPALREELVGLGAPALLVHKTWVALPTLISLALVATVFAIRGRADRATPSAMLPGSAPAGITSNAR
jgi:hypothetical protein